MRRAPVLISLLLLLSITTADAQTQPGGRFGYSYPAMSGAIAQAFPRTFAALMHNPSAFQAWLAAGTDPRRLNPTGVYLKHINVRSIQALQSDPKIEGRPSYAWIKQNHPEWVVKDGSGLPVNLFGIPGEELMDLSNPAYLDWIVNTFLPQQVFDQVDVDTPITWFMHDVGHFFPLAATCGSNAVCIKNTSPVGVPQVWEVFLASFKARWPQKKIVINITGPLTYMPVADQMAVYTRVLAKADGAFNECLTESGCYWSTAAGSGKRIALATMMQLATWLADQRKVFMPNVGINAPAGASQAEVNYQWAFFNLLRKGDLQFFTRNTGNFTPVHYPEMDRALGTPTEPATEQAPNVWRRDYTGARAYVNLSDATVSLPLPAGTYTNALGQASTSPLVLASFSGLTLYKAP